MIVVNVCLQKRSFAPFIYNFHCFNQFCFVILDFYSVDFTFRKPVSNFLCSGGAIFLTIYPYREFVSCVRCIRILSPAEVQQMSEEGMQLLNSNAIPRISGAAQTCQLFQTTKCHAQGSPKMKDLNLFISTKDICDDSAQN